MAAKENLAANDNSSLRIFDPKCKNSKETASTSVNILSNLFSRETFGSYNRKHSRVNQRTQAFKPLPPNACFTLPLQEMIPETALRKGHIVLGLSRCGQFLLTYTVGSFDALLGYTHTYILHWWACVPRSTSRRISEVTLFKDQELDGNLFLSVCQWPNDNSKIIIYGISEAIMPMSTQSKIMYITVTMIPSLNKCTDCKYLNAAFDEDDVAANWECSLLTGCLKHSATVHSSCELVSPYPEFEPEINLKLDGKVIINTGNFLHVITVELENRDRNTCMIDPVLQLYNKDDELLLSSMMLQNCEVAQVRSVNDPNASPIMFLKSPQYFMSDDTVLDKCLIDSESDDSSITDIPTVNYITKREKFFSDNTEVPKAKQLAEAEKVFEFIDEHPPDIKLSAYRLRRLADKKYEFCADEDESENIIPYRRQECNNSEDTKEHQQSTPVIINQAQNQQRRQPQSNTVMQELLIHTSPPYSPSGDVLRPLNSNTLGSPTPTTTNTNSQQQYDETKFSPRPGSALASPGYRSTTEQRKPFTYLVKLQRRYFEVDDEVVSVITDIEDDDIGALTGYHSALPLEVHGPGYVQLQMISNTKAEKLRVSCVLVQQTSFDIEQFCHEVAQIMCADAGVKYWYCKDYDVEIFDVCPNSGDVIVVAFILLQATTRIKNTRFPLNSTQRRSFQGSFIFSWNLETGRYWVLSTSSLREQDTANAAIWNPARAERQSMRRITPPLPTHPPVRCLMNRSVIRGQSLTSLLDTENHIRIVLHE